MRVVLAGDLGIPPGGWTSRGIAEGMPVEVLDVVETSDGELVRVAVADVLVGAKMMELGMDIVVAESVPVGTREAGAWEEVDVVDGADVVVLASTVVAVVAGVEGCVEITSLVEDSLLVVDVEGTSVDIGNVADVLEGTTSVAELLPVVEMIGVSILLGLVVEVGPVVRGAVGVIVGSEEVVKVPFDDTVEDGRGIGTTDAPDVLSEYEPVDIPVPVMVAVFEALDDASDDAALDKMPENSEDNDDDTAGLVATMLES